MRLDRGLQREILERLREAYPNAVELATLPCAAHPEFQPNLHYLHELHLIEGTRLSDRGPSFVMGRITAQGLDFLEGDGGAAAILRARSNTPQRETHDSDTT